MKDTFDGFRSRLIIVKGKNQLNERYVDRNFPNWKAKRKKDKKYRTDYHKNYETIRKCVTE